MRGKHGRWVMAGIAALLLIWMVWGNRTVGVTDYIVSSDKLPEAFDNYKIAVVSDVHNAEYGENNRLLISVIQKENPDMIAITGDLVDANKTDMEAAKNLAKQLVELAPCYYVTGNHEAWIGEQYQELEEKLLDIGVNILHDRAVKVIKNGETIQIAGLDDLYFAGGDLSVQENRLKTRLQEMNLTEDYCILLSHRPEFFHIYVSENVDLTVSGHTHGGQFRLPFVGGVIAPNQGIFPKYDAGKYSENGRIMIVSRGIGNSIIPVRFHNRPEVAVVELHGVS